MIVLSYGRHVVWRPTVISDFGIYWKALASVVHTILDQLSGKLGCLCTISGLKQKKKSWEEPEIENNV